MKKILLMIFSVFMLGALFVFAKDSSRRHYSVRMTEDDEIKINEIRENAVKAKRLFENANESYENGNRKKAKELYERSMSLLGEIELDEDYLYSLKDEYMSLFGGLDKVSFNFENSSSTDNLKYAIPMNLENETVKKYLEIYTQGAPKKRINGALERSTIYRDMVLNILKEYNLPEELIYLPVVESLYNNDVRSHAGALGLWQLMPHRARALGLKVNYWVDERKDPEKATYAACKYLKELYLIFNDWHLALSAYNRGENGLLRDINFSRATNIDELSKRRAVPEETEKFVPKFIVCTTIGDNYMDYGFNPDFQKTEEYDEVIINDVVDLEIAAKCAGTSVKVIKGLNPQIKAWCTPLNYPDFKLKLPKGSGEHFSEEIAKVEDLNPSRGYVKYKVRKGDCLSLIAKKFHTGSGEIKKDNKISNANCLGINQVLIIRPGRTYYE